MAHPAFLNGKRVGAKGTGGRKCGSSRNPQWEARMRRAQGFVNKARRRVLQQPGRKREREERRDAKGEGVANMARRCIPQ